MVVIQSTMGLIGLIGRWPERGRWKIELCVFHVFWRIELDDWVIYIGFRFRFCFGWLETVRNQGFSGLSICLELTGTGSVSVHRNLTGSCCSSLDQVTLDSGHLHHCVTCYIFLESLSSSVFSFDTVGNPSFVIDRAMGNYSTPHACGWVVQSLPNTAVQDFQKKGCFDIIPPGGTRSRSLPPASEDLRNLPQETPKRRTCTYMIVTTTPFSAREVWISWARSKQHSGRIKGCRNWRYQYFVSYHLGCKQLRYLRTWRISSSAIPPRVEVTWGITWRDGHIGGWKSLLRGIRSEGNRKREMEGGERREG